MKRYFLKSFLSMLLVVLLIFPAMVYASNEDDVTIRGVYFRDEDGNIVYVDYEYAINEAMDGDSTLYDAIKEYVGITEEKGRTLYIETNTGKVLDYRMALIDGLFRLEDIIGKRKYEFTGDIEYTHELRIVNGKARIVEKGEIVDIVRITPVGNIIVELGTTEDEAIELLPYTTTIKDSLGNTHEVYLNWTIENYNGNVQGEYTAIGTFELPDGIENNRGLRLQVRTKVIVAGWPSEVESVDIVKSIITEKTYANINIRSNKVSKVEGVYLDGILANQIENEPSQWRIEVADGTTEDDLRGRITVQLEEPTEEPEIIATYHPSFIPTFGTVTVEVYNLEDAAKFSVVYHLSDDEDGTPNIEETGIVNIGEEAGLIFYDPNQYDTINIKIYDETESLIHTFKNVRF